MPTKVKPLTEAQSAEFELPVIPVREDAHRVVHEYPESHGSLVGILSRIYDLEDQLAKESKGKFKPTARPALDREAWHNELRDQWDKENPDSLVDARGKRRPAKK